MKEGIAPWILAVSFVGTFLLVVLISFLIFKFYFKGKCIRKKKANELNDDDFDYTSKEEEKKDKDNTEEEKNNDENNNLGIDFEE